MKITVINGTEKQGVTYRMKELFLQAFTGKADITEYYLPKDCPNFCCGCTNCFLRGENACKDAGQIKIIEKSLLEADLLVMTSPAYVFHATGAMKVFLDHFAYRWMPHRPAPEMFTKRAVILTQCAGAGAKSAARDIKHSLSWWGVPQIDVFTSALMSDIVWDKLPQTKQAELTRKLEKLSRKFAHIDYHKPAKTNLIIKIKFSFCRAMQKSLHKTNPQYPDGKYWAQQGWLDGVRPWNSNRKKK